MPDFISTLVSFCDCWNGLGVTEFSVLFAEFELNWSTPQGDFSDGSLMWYVTSAGDIHVGMWEHTGSACFTATERN